MLAFYLLEGLTISSLRMIGWVMPKKSLENHVRRCRFKNDGHRDKGSQIITKNY